jgi:hypothetical protein
MQATGVKLDSIARVKWQDENKLVTGDLIMFMFGGCIYNLNEGSFKARHTGFIKADLGTKCVYSPSHLKAVIETAQKILESSVARKTRVKYHIGFNPQGVYLPRVSTSYGWRTGGIYHSFKD